MNARTYSVLRSRLARPLILTILFAMLATLAVTSGKARAELAAYPVDNGQILFESDMDGNREIYVMNADGGGVTRLTNHPANDRSPAWSPDGTQIAYASNRDGNSEIYVMNADGSEQTRLTSNEAFDYHPAWSPDGAKIAFASDRVGGNSEIFVMNADGSAPINLTNHPGENYEPDWSPDGTKIAFSSYRDNISEIYVMNADGSDQTRLTFNLGAEDYEPDWSPDGMKIAFTSIRRGEDDVFVMNPDGSDQTNLTSDPDSEYNSPSWSPDGTQIAFTSDRDGEDDIYIMNADGSAPIKITSSEAFDFSPDWGSGLSKRLYINPNRRNAVLQGEGGPFVAQRQDIVVNELGTDIWALFFDGSVHGLNKNVTSLAFYDSGACATGPALLLTFNGIQKLPGFEANPQDVAAFCPDVSGEYNGTGTWSIFFDGSDVGLTRRGEIIDALELRPDGRMVISTKGNFEVPGTVAPATLSGQKNDLLLFNPLQYGANTVGTWDLYFNHVLIKGLERENIISAYQDGDNLYMSFWNRWRINGLRGDSNDIVIVHPDYSIETFWDGNMYGFPYRIHGIHIE